MNLAEIRKLTNIIYRALFDKDTTMLLIQFRISPLALQDEDDEELRDCMGILALQALQEIEHRCWEEMQRSGEQVAWTIIEDATRIIANEVAVEAKAMAAGQGIDLLTGVPITSQNQ